MKKNVDNLLDKRIRTLFKVIFMEKCLNIIFKKSKELKTRKKKKRDLDDYEESKKSF